MWVVLVAQLSLYKDMLVSLDQYSRCFDVSFNLSFDVSHTFGQVPIPGNTTVAQICALSSDVGTMAYRLKKPLTVRLFPVPGLKAGDMTTFEDDDDLCTCTVFQVP